MKRKHEYAVLVTNKPVCRRPIEHIRKLDVLRVVRAFKEIQHIQLLGRSHHTRRYKMVLVQNQIGLIRLLAIGRYLARVNRTFRTDEHITTLNSKCILIK